MEVYHGKKRALKYRIIVSMKQTQKIIAWFLIGMFLIATALFADKFGFDPNASWGKGRITILAMGIFVSGSSLICHFYKSKIDKIISAIKEKIESAALIRWWHNRSKGFQVIFLSAPLIFLVFIIYIWFLSVGQWTKWNTLTAYYDWQAVAFMHGQISLEMQPDPALLKLANPYDPKERSGIPSPLDISLYKGRYYLYWGPVPSLVLALVRPFIKGEIGDQYLVFAFLSGIFIIQILILLNLWKRYFSDLPRWTFLIGIPVIGLILPYAWICMTPRVYDAAITSAQFFLIAGFYAALRVMESSKLTYSKLITIGALFALTIGSRLTQIVPVGFVILMILWGLYQMYPQTRTLFGLTSNALALGLPILIGCLLLGWFNWARFDNVFETGFRYALAGPYLQSYKGGFFSPSFAIQNLYNYFLNPLRTRAIFPFIKPILGQNTSVASFIILPNIYSSDELAGLIYSAPFLLFSLITIIAAVLRPGRSRRTDMSLIHKEKDDPLFYWTCNTLVVLYISAFAPLILFFWATTRYLADFMPAFALISVIGFWQGFKILRNRPVIQSLFGFLGIGLSGITALTSILVAASSHMARFRAVNPNLLNQLIQWFGG